MHSPAVDSFHFTSQQNSPPVCQTFIKHLPCNFLKSFLKSVSCNQKFKIVNLSTSRLLKFRSQSTHSLINHLSHSTISNFLNNSLISPSNRHLLESVANPKVLPNHSYMSGISNSQKSQGTVDFNYFPRKNLHEWLHKQTFYSA
jgi:hypothetical protein